MDNITEEQKELVNELRKRTISDVTPKMLEDVSLFYRFAKARDFNLEEAEDMLRKHISWRKDMQIDTLLTDYEPPKVLVKYLPTNFLCFDKQGSVVRLNDGGRADIKGLWSASKRKDLAKYIAYVVEKDREMVIKQGRHLGNPFYSIIYDFENLSYSNCVSMKTLQFSIYFVKMFCDNYPETIRRLYMVNAPGYFAWFFAAIKPFLPDPIIQKVRIFGAKTDTWKEDLLQFIDADKLPAYLGGKKTDPDGNPLCKTLILRGRPVPKSYYLSNGSKKLAFESDVEKLTLLPFSKEEIALEVKQENSYIKWEFEIKSRDVDFSLVFRDESSEDFNSVELIPKQRIETSDEPERGCLKCEKPGTYTIIFDNSFSWLHSKEVYYRAGVHNSGNENIFES